MCFALLEPHWFLLGGMSGSGASATKNSRICNPRTLAKYQNYPHDKHKWNSKSFTDFLKTLVSWSIYIFNSIPVRWAAAWTWNKFSKVSPRIFIALHHRWLELSSDLSLGHQIFIDDQHLWSFLCAAHLWETIHFHSYSNTSNEICIKLHILLNFNGVISP